MEQFLRQHQLEGSVRLLGSTPHGRVRELLCASDILFLPSKWEGIAQVLFEAMSCGVAVVGADVGGQAELVTSDCGVLLPRADEATEVLRYTEALAQLLRDPAGCARLGQHGRQRIVEHFQLNDMGKRMAGLFEHARELHRTQPRETPSQGLGLACATEAIEFTRLSGVADHLWQQQNRTSPSVPTQVKNGDNVWTRLALRVGRQRRARQTVRP